MKRILTVILAILLLMSMSTFFASAEGATDYFDTDIKLELSADKYEIGRSVKYTIKFPEFKHIDEDIKDNYIIIGETIYHSLFIKLTSITDANNILTFSRTNDYGYTYYHGYFAPLKSGETHLIAQFQVCGFIENGEEVALEGEEWKFTVMSENIKVEEVEFESGYVEDSSSEETFDINDFYMQNNTSSEDITSDSSNSDSNNSGNIILKIFLIVAVLILIFAIAYFVIRAYKDKKRKK